jgi:hypothetical protein
LVKVPTKAAAVNAQSLPKRAQSYFLPQNGKIFLRKKNGLTDMKLVNTKLFNYIRSISGTFQSYYAILRDKTQEIYQRYIIFGKKILAHQQNFFS